MTTHRNVIIIGGGPAGYTAALYCARADLVPMVFEGTQYGGALMNTTEVENFPGFEDGILGPELMDRLRTQAERFGADLISDDVVEVELSGPVKRLRTLAGEYTADAVILAMGSSYKRLGIAAEDRLSGHGVSWCATCDGFFFRDQDVAVVGGGDTALEEALFLTRFANSVTVIHRRSKLRSSRIMADRAAANTKIRWSWNSEVVAIEGKDALNGVRLRDTLSGSERMLTLGGLFIAIGHEPRNALVVGQVDIDADGYIRTLDDGLARTHTNLAGVFAAGDVVDKHYRQAVTAAGSGCQAAIDAERYLAATVDSAGALEMRQRSSLTAGTGAGSFASHLGANAMMTCQVD
jgi:thioredoxin reductase (NADPH)